MLNFFPLIRLILKMKQLAIIVIFSSSVLYADVLFLTMPYDSRGMAMGEAMTASAIGVSAMRFNPAGLGFTPMSEVQASQYFLGPELSGTGVMGTYSFSPFFSTGFFVNTLYLTKDIHEVSNYQQTGRTLGFFDMETGVSFGYAILPQLSTGVNIRYFRFKLGQEVAQSVGADVGVQYKFNPFRPKSYQKFAVGFALRNLGPTFSYYGGGEKQAQPWQVRFGLAYLGYKWVEPSADIVYSDLEGMSYHAGLVILPQYLLSPRLGLKYDFSGLSMTFGGGLSYGKTYKFNLIGGTSISTGGTSYSNTFFSILVQRNTLAHNTMQDEEIVYVPPKVITMEAVESLYRPAILVPYNPPVRAEKIQGIVIEQEKAEGFLHIVQRLRRVAIQPQDEVYLKKMSAENATEVIVKNRPYGVWLNPKNIPEEEVVDLWDMLAQIIESRSKAEVMLGADLSKLNDNPNAPLKVEFELVTKYQKSETGDQEIRTFLKELYTGKVIAAKNFKIYEGEDFLSTWRQISFFYADYFSKLNAFYKIRIKRKKHGT